MVSVCLLCFFFSLIVMIKCFCTIVLLPSCLCLSVRLSCQQTVYVVSGGNLVLTADFGSENHVTNVTWEHMGKGKSVKTIVAEYPARSNAERVTLDKGGAVMTLRNYQGTDTGMYTVTVRDEKGDQSSSQCAVNEYGMKWLYLSLIVTTMLNTDSIIFIKFYVYFMQDVYQTCKEDLPITD